MFRRHPASTKAPASTGVLFSATRAKTESIVIAL